MTQQLVITDIQFSGNDLTNQKLRRLVQDLAAAEGAINSLIKTISASSGTATTTFASPALSSEYPVSGLATGEVLQALSATSAAFAKLSLSALAGVSISSPVKGQVLTYENGEWTNVTPTATPAAATVTSAAKIGTGASVYAGVQNGTHLAFKAIDGDPNTIQVTETNDTITLTYVGPVPTITNFGPVGPPGLDGDPGEDMWFPIPG